MKPNFRDFEVELEALQTKDVRKKNRIEGSAGVDKGIKVAQNNMSFRNPI